MTFSFRQIAAFTLVAVAAIAPVLANSKTAPWIPQGTMEKPIPRTMSGDRGRYFLLGVVKQGGIYTSLSKRVGTDSTGYTVCEIDWKRNLIRDLGYSEESPAKIKRNPSKWYAIESGSSKSDMANFIVALRLK